MGQALTEKCTECSKTFSENEMHYVREKYVCDGCVAAVMARRFDYERDPTSEYRRGARATPYYAKLIREVIGCADDEVGGVERVMRDKFGTLDNLSRAEFRREAREALDVLRALWAGE